MPRLWHSPPAGPGRARRPAGRRGVRGVVPGKRSARLLAARVGDARDEWLSIGAVSASLAFASASWEAGLRPSRATGPPTPPASSAHAAMPPEADVLLHGT